MGFRDRDATKAVHELRVSVRCNMAARTNACSMSGPRLGKQEPGKLSFSCAVEPELVSSAWQLLFHRRLTVNHGLLCGWVASSGSPREERSRLREERASTLSPRRL